TRIPYELYICYSATGIAPTPSQGSASCIGSTPGTCAQHPSGPPAAQFVGLGSGVSTTAWAVPRPSLTDYPALDLSGSQFPLFPLDGADGTYIFPATLPSISPYSTTP